MAGRDYNSFLAALRLHREHIEEAILVLERLVKIEKTSNKAPTWAKALTEHDEDDEHGHVTYTQMLSTLRQNREHVEEAILAIERLARGRDNSSETPQKRAGRKGKGPAPTGKSGKGK